MDTQTFTGIDADKWGRIKDAVKSKLGIVIASDVGQAHAKGITLGWNYAAGALTTTLLGRSFYDPSTEEIDTDLAKWVASA